MPKVIELFKSSLMLGTKVACSNFIIKLSSHMKHELQPYAGNNKLVFKKILAFDKYGCV